MPGAKKMTPAEKKAEKMLKNKMKQNKVKDINKTRDKIAKKTGVYPMGRTR